MDKANLKNMTKLMRRCLYPGQQEKRVKHAQGLLTWCHQCSSSTANSQKVIVWTDKKNFGVDQYWNRRNDRVIVRKDNMTSRARIIQRSENPTKDMVF